MVDHPGENEYEALVVQGQVYLSTLGIFSDIQILESSNSMLIIKLICEIT